MSAKKRPAEQSEKPTTSKNQKTNQIPNIESLDLNSPQIGFYELYGENKQISNYERFSKKLVYRHGVKLINDNSQLSNIKCVIQAINSIPPFVSYYEFNFWTDLIDCLYKSDTSCSVSDLLKGMKDLFNFVNIEEFKHVVFGNMVDANLQVKCPSEILSDILSKLGEELKPNGNFIKANFEIKQLNSFCECDKKIDNHSFILNIDISELDLNISLTNCIERKLIEKSVIKCTQCNKTLKQENCIPNVLSIQLNRPKNKNISVDYDFNINLKENQLDLVSIIYKKNGNYAALCRNYYYGNWFDCSHGPDLTKEIEQKVLNNTINDTKLTCFLFIMVKRSLINEPIYKKEQNQKVNAALTKSVNIRKNRRDWKTLFIPADYDENNLKVWNGLKDVIGYKCPVLNCKKNLETHQNIKCHMYAQHPDEWNKFERSSLGAPYNEKFDFETNVRKSISQTVCNNCGELININEIKQHSLLHLDTYNDNCFSYIKLNEPFYFCAHEDCDTFNARARHLRKHSKIFHTTFAINEVKDTLENFDVIRHVSKTAKAISSDKRFLFNPEYTNLNGGEIFCKSDNIQSVYNKLGFVMDSSCLKKGLKQGQERNHTWNVCEHSSLCNILPYMRSSSFIHEQIAHTIVDGFKTWKCPHFDTCNFQISQDLLFLPNEWDSYFDTKIKNLNDERLANNKSKLSKKELQEIQIERGLPGLKFHVIPLIYYEIFNHFKYHAFNDLFIKMLLKKPRLPLNETKILSFNVGSLQYHWENILLSLLRSDFGYDFLLFQETKGFVGTIPGYENNSSKKCQIKFTTKLGKNIEQTIHGVTTFNCTLQTTDGQIMKATQLSLENFLNKQTVLKKGNVLQNMSVVISMFKKIQFDSDSNTCFRYNNSGLFNVIANVYAPQSSSPYTFHAEPLLNEILPNLMENENLKIRLFCGDSNAPIIWKNLRNPSPFIRVPNSKILIEQFTKNTNLRQHNMDIANTSGCGHGNLIDVVIDTFDPQKNEKEPTISISNKGHLNKYSYHSAIDVVVKEEEKTAHSNQKNDPNLFDINSFNTILHVPNNVRDWKGLNAHIFNSKCKLLNDKKTIKIETTNERFRYVAHENSFGIECNYCDSTNPDTCSDNNLRSHFVKVHSNNYVISRLNDIKNILKELGFILS